MSLRLLAFVLAILADIHVEATELAHAPYGVMPQPVAFNGKPRGPVTPKDGEGFERAVYRALLRQETAKVDLPFDLADAVMAVESGYDPAVLGASGEIGLMQVMPPTAAMLGFRGDTASLALPQTNIHYGVTYLARALSLANGDICRALMKYRAGHGEEIMTAKSVAYCARAKAHLTALASPLAARVVIPQVDLAIPVQVPGKPIPAAYLARPRNRTPAVSRAFWAAQEARIKVINARIEARWGRVAAR